MDSALSPTAPARVIPVADLRPTADAAAIARDPAPFIALPIPASTAQAGAITESRLTGALAPNRLTLVDPAERTLKPYGVLMLPGEPVEGLLRSTSALDDGTGDSG